MVILVNKNFCSKDHQCEAAKICPMEALSQKDINSAPEVDPEKCVDCGKCIDFCPQKALQFKQ